MRFYIDKKIKMVLIFFICLCLYVGCDSDLFKAKEVPIITGMTAEQYEVNPGDTVKISVSVKDSDDESLQYKWSADGGQFVPPVNCPEVYWIAPEDGGDYWLTVKVSNLDGDSDPRSEKIYVRIKEAPVIQSLNLSANEVDPGDTIKITVQLKDMEDPTLVYNWTADGGQFLAPGNEPAVFWKAPAVGGEYHIELIVSNNKKQSAPESRTITVRSYAAPFVEIVSPVDGSLFIQYTTIQIQAIANHQNGIETVRLYINDQFQSEIEGKSTEDYQFTYSLSGPEGVNKIRADAVAKLTGVIGSDSVQVRVEGVILGK